jgi:hypothetical protein
MVTPYLLAEMKLEGSKLAAAIRFGGNHILPHLDHPKDRTK